MKDQTKVKARNVGLVAELKIKDPNIYYTNFDLSVVLVDQNQTKTMI